MYVLQYHMFIHFIGLTQVSLHPNLMLDKYYINYICDGNTMEMECNTMETRVGQRQLIENDTCPLYYGIFI